jgi:flagellar biosynthesis protein FlhF
MQIKKFTAPTLKQASIQMKNELGGEAIILGTRVIYGEGSNKKKMFEITAGIEEEETVLEYSESSAESYSSAAEQNFSDEIRKLNDKIFINPASGNDSSVHSRPTIKKQNKPEFNNVVDRELKEIVDVLLNREVQKPLTASLISQLKRYKGFLHESNLDSYVLSSLASMIPTYQFEVKKGASPKIVALVGPTGVGKTTCIAKLAVISKILHNLSVGLISIDTYRLGAIDQLRIFSEISNVDMLVAYEPKDMPGLMNSFKDKDIIFIDTAGRSQNNKEQLLNTAEFLKAGNVDETYLVLSSTGTTKNLSDVAEKFKLFDYSSVIFTKIDEAVTFGNILNIVNKFNVPASFLTNGQVIPDDIISADPEYIANMIYTGKIN